jgi:pimeloyl-ACP methyl ester carboxylesterase
MTTEIRTTTAAGLHVYESGAVGAPVLLFLHGSPLSGRMWLPQLEVLAEFHCLAPDLPEHGLSQAVRPFSMDDCVRRLGSLVREAAPGGRTYVVGLSFGGVVA